MDVGGGEEEDSSPPPRPSIHQGLLEILKLHGLEKYAFLSQDELNAFVVELVTSEEVRRFREESLNLEIDKYNRTHPNSYHPQIYNEMACCIDYIIKLKANIIGLDRKLKEGSTKVRIHTLPDGEFNDRPTPDIYTFVPSSFKMEICTGAGKNHFNDYKQFEGTAKVLEESRYMVGLFSGRVYDTNSGQGEGAVLISEDPDPDRYMRELEPKPDIGKERSGLKVSLRNEGAGASSRPYHKLSLHRLIQSLATHLGASVFHDGMFEDLGIEFLDGRTYDNTIAYCPSSDNNLTRSILKALRVGTKHSKKCDGDHRLGHLYLYCHALGHCQATSHRMNTCFSHVRQRAGHWCFGLGLSEYTGGQDTNPVDDCFLKKVTIDEEGRARFNGKPIKPIKLCDLLPKQDDWYTGDVDCYCDDTGGKPKGTDDSRCFVCIYKDKKCFCRDLLYLPKTAEYAESKCWKCLDEDCGLNDEDNEANA